MVNGEWLMRDQILLTLDEQALIAEAQGIAKEIDLFLKDREESVLSKLVAIGGTMQEESFEVQAKVRVDDLEPVLKALNQPGIEIVRKRHYHEYDTYFRQADPSQGRLRYREDEFIGENGEITNVRSRLTLIGESGEKSHLNGEEIMLSRSRYLAPATQSLRFYREYFKPVAIEEIVKDRRRFLIKFEGTEFFVNLDDVTKPNLGKFVEIKSRTWSRQDAQLKVKLMQKLLETLGLASQPLVTKDYIYLVEEGEE
jgi:5-methylthioadenosine/S-adenosylhomocysteine deaminase